MNTRMKIICAAIAAIFVWTSCSKLNSGDSFNQTIDGIEYNFEVIVSKMTYVKISPAHGPSDITGTVTIPAFGEYDGVIYAVTQIKEKAFQDYTGITSVQLPELISQIGDKAFAGCTSLTEINSPQTLSVIGKYAFDGCIALKEFSLEASISKLGEGAFRNCESLGTPKFTPTFSEIPDYVFQGCSSIEAIELPSTIMSIGKSAFEGCINVQEINMDRSIRSIGSRAFYNCSMVNKIECLTGEPPICSEDTFGLIDPDIPVTVPQAGINAYRNATGWNIFTNFTGTYQ